MAEQHFCNFCRGTTAIADEYEDWKISLTRITPLPSINLSTGMKAQKADPPYYALFLSYLDAEYGAAEQGSFPIKYCPMCGRKLEG